MTSRSFGRALVVSAVLVAGAADAYAQTAPQQRRSRALFGNSAGNTEQSLTLGLSFGGAYDDNILAGETSTATEMASRSGVIGQMGAALGYSFGMQRFSLAGSLASSAGYYPDLAKPWIQHHSAFVSASYQLAERTRLSGAQALSYDPRYSLTQFPEVFGSAPDAPPSPDDTLDLLLTRHVMSSSSIDLSHGLTRRMTVSANAAYSRSESSHPDVVPELSVRSYAGRLTVNIARGLDLRAGYGQSEGLYTTTEGEQRHRQDNIDAGLDFTRAISLSRKTQLGFTTGATGTEYGGHRQYRLTGSARLTREIGRSWHAGVAVARDVGFWEVFQEPVVSDAVQTFVGGLINRRVQWSSGLGAARGEIGLTETGTRFTTYYGTSGLQIGLSQFVGVAASYSYYRHMFEGSGPLPLGVRPRTDRQSIRVQLLLWAPLIQRTRSSNATR